MKNTQTEKMKNSFFLPIAVDKIFYDFENVFKAKLALVEKAISHLEYPQ